ncbi:MAG: TolC family protein [Bacteroides sp.]|nr:TolC family protein [Bacteroides sp.]
MKFNLFIAAFLFSGAVQAQSIDEILRSIEQNSPELKSQQQATHAAQMEVQTLNNLEDPSVEYSPFFAKGVEGVASSELVVKQGFDFPTLYAARKKQGKLQQEVLNRRNEMNRREVLLRAKTLCLDLIRLNQEQKLLEQRKKNAEELLALFNERLEKGDANILEVNKIKMERMNVQTEVAQNAAAHRNALQQLLAMNGNLPLEFACSSYPVLTPVTSYSALYDEVMTTDATLLEADATARAADKELSVNRQNWLPKLEVAYRRNTSLGEKSNGFLVGGSIPLFSKRKRTQIARAQAISAQLQRDDVRLKTEANIQSQFNEIQQLNEAMQAYDIPLMHQTLDLLKQAVTAGQLSIIDYYVEAEGVYRNLQAYMEIENQYQKLMATVYKNRL